MYPYAIFVNTTDKFEDCWLPFFKLFARYWPDYAGTIYLNTEYKEFKYGNLNIVSVRNGKVPGKPPATWSECLAAGLNFTDNEILLYMQEDYFLREPVSNKLIYQYAELMREEEIDCIHLTDQHSSGPFEPSSFGGLWSMAKYSNHKISCQTALWKKAELLRYIRNYESPWQFELYGTLRAQLSNPNFYTLDRHIYGSNRNEVVPYIFTGVIQGKWYDKVVELFERHQIEMDYQKRGFITEGGKYALMPRIRRKIKDINKRSILEIMKVRFFGRSLGTQE